MEEKHLLAEKMMKLPTLFHADQSGIEISPLFQFIPSQLENSIHRSGAKIVSSRFLSRLCSHINSPLKLFD